MYDMYTTTKWVIAIILCGGLKSTKTTSKLVVIMISVHTVVQFSFQNILGQILR